jgi:uncharacterized membrane protein
MTDNPPAAECPEPVEGAVPQDMLEILVNGVFAFAMTLIVKNNIPVPSTIPTEDFSFLINYLSSILSDGIDFLFTFLILAVFYILFFEMMRHTRVNDRIVVSFTFAFALSILFIPLTSLLWALSDEPVPYGVLFHANVILASLLMIFLWRHISTNTSLCHPGPDPAIVTSISRRLLLFPATAAVGLVLDSWDVSFGQIPITILYMVPVILFVYLSRSPSRGSETTEISGPANGRY